MGRRKLHKTPEQIAEQKRRWAETRNAKRRQQYATDDAYRSAVHTQNRTGYRERTGSELRNCRENIANLQDFGSIRAVSIDGCTTHILTYTVVQLAKAIGGYHPVALYRWQRQDRFPRPTTQAIDCKVFTFDQAHKILVVMSEHQDKKLYLQKSDTDTINRLRDAIRPPEA